MIPEERVLYGWMAILCYQLSQGVAPRVPEDVMDGLLGNEWVEVNDDDYLFVTERGRMIGDLFGPEWGIDSIPEVQADA